MTNPPSHGQPQGLSQPRGGWRKPGERATTTGDPSDPNATVGTPFQSVPATVANPPVAAPGPPPTAAYSLMPTRAAPANSLALAVIGCVLFLPVGIYAVVKSLQVAPHWQSGDDVSANIAARRARTAALAAIGTGLAAIVIAALAVIIVG